MWWPEAVQEFHPAMLPNIEPYKAEDADESVIEEVVTEAPEEFDPGAGLFDDPEKVEASSPIDENGYVDRGDGVLRPAKNRDGNPLRARERRIRLRRDGQFSPPHPKLAALGIGAQPRQAWRWSQLRRHRSPTRIENALPAAPVQGPEYQYLLTHSRLAARVSAGPEYEWHDAPTGWAAEVCAPPPYVLRRLNELAIAGADISGYPDHAVALAAAAREDNRLAQDLEAASRIEPPSNKDAGDLQFSCPKPAHPNIARTYRELYDREMLDNRRAAHDGSSSRSREALSPWDGPYSAAGRVVTSEKSDAHDTYGEAGGHRHRIKIFLGTEDYSRETALVINGRLDKHVQTQWAVGQRRGPGPQASGDAAPVVERVAKHRAKENLKRVVEEISLAPPAPRNKGGRKPIGDKPMTDAERQQKRSWKRKAEKAEAEANT
jgi:hypothetical protein